MAKSPIHRGGCLCGAVRYEARGKPHHVGNCHCTMCQKVTGAPFGTFAGFAAADVRFTKGRPKNYRSSKWAYRGFCPKCGSTLTYGLANDKSKLWLSLGTMDKPGALPPKAHIFVGTMHPWVKRTKDGLPRFKGFGD